MFINSPIHRFTNSPTGDSPNCSVSSDSPIHRFTDSPIDGVTLVELIIVIAIIGIIVLFATIDTGWFQRDARVSEARDRLLADVEDIKIKSLAEVPHAVFFIIVGGTSTSYTVRKLIDSDSDFKRDATEGTTILSTVTLSTNVKVIWTVGGNGEELWFDRKGIPKTSIWTMGGNTITIWYDADNDGVIDSDEPSKIIYISNGGRIQYEVRQ